MATNPSSGDGEPRREQIADDLSAALGNLREAVDRLRQEVEANAKEEWVRAKPELKTTLGDLQKMIDAAAERAKTLLGDLGNRLDADDNSKKS